MKFFHNLTAFTLFLLSALIFLSVCVGVLSNPIGNKTWGSSDQPIYVAFGLFISIIFFTLAFGVLKRKRWSPWFLLVIIISWIVVNVEGFFSVISGSSVNPINDALFLAITTILPLLYLWALLKETRPVSPRNRQKNIS